jgi:hypothetical protein
VLCRYAEKIAKTGNADIEPLSSFVSRIDLRSVGRHEALHAVVASSQENRTNYVDENVQEGIDGFRFVTALFRKQADAVSNEVSIAAARPNRK